MKPNHMVTVMVYGLKIFGLAPFSYQIITMRKKHGTTCNVRGFRFSKIGMAYNILLVILIQVMFVVRFVSRFPNPGSMIFGTAIFPLMELTFTIFATNVTIISSTFRQGKAVTLMNRLVQVDCLLTDFENQSVFNKMTYVSFSIHLIFTLILWITKYTAVLRIQSKILWPTTTFLCQISIYSFIMEYSVVLVLLSREFYRANRSLLKVKELPNHLSCSPFSNDFLPVLRFPTKTHQDDVKLLLEIRTTLYELSRDVAEFFSFPIFVNIAYSFFEITILLLNSIEYLTHLDLDYVKILLFALSLSLIILTFPIVILSLSVKNAVKEAKLTGSIIHKLLAAPTMREMKVKLRWFSLQLLHERVNFTGYDFFALEPTIIHSIFDGAILYLMTLYGIHGDTTY